MALRILLVSVLLTLGCITSSLAQAAIKHQVDIPAQELGSALAMLARQTKIQFVYSAELVEGQNALELHGTMTPEEALDRLLATTRLKYEFIDPRTVTLKDVSARRSSAGGTSDLGALSVVLRRAGGEEEKEGNYDGPRTWWQRIRLAQAEERSSSESAAQGEDETGLKRLKLDEVIVTAQKREERLIDVPVPVATVNADALVDNNQVLLRDYLTSVPSVYVMPSAQSQQTLSIRGVTTGIGNPTVGVTIDDMPYGSSTNFGGGRTVPDIDPGDLARVEVLRGPQGMLYGANSLGGLLKFVTRDPSTDNVNGRVQAGVNGVENGDGLGYNARGSINVPLSETFSIRASAFKRRDTGYVDNVQSGEDGINRADAVGGRLSALWRPAESFSLKLNALLQEIDGDGATSVDPPLGDLQQSRLRDTGWYERKARAYSANLSARLGEVDLAAITGYSENAFNDALDIGFLLSGVAQAQFGVSGVSLLGGSSTDKLSQEIRVSIPIGERFEWMLGAFYMDEDSTLLDDRVAVNPATGGSVGRLSLGVIPTTYEEYAAFTNMTFRITERFDVQVGGRQSEISQSLSQTSTNAQGVQTSIPEFRSKSDAFTYLVTPRLKLSTDVMLYARMASGYRPGGPNTFPGGIVPTQYEPDKSRNYEIGVKGDFFDHSLSLDASIYSIDWDDLQLVFVNPATVTSYIINGSSARSRGVELSVESTPWRGATIAGWAAWNDTELTENFPAGGTAFGLSGDRLPISSRFSGYLSVEQDFPISGDTAAFVGASLNHVGDRVGPFRAVPLRETFPAYRQVDLRAGLRKASWTANVFVTNVEDERGVIYGGLGATPPTAYAYIQPRTIGATLSIEF